MKKLIFIGLIIFICSCTYHEKTQINHEFEIQGFTARTFSYYYDENIYSAYNNNDNARLIDKAKNSGANYLLIRAFYNGTADGGLIGDEKKAMKSLEKMISTSHKNGLKIFLAPYVESRDYNNKIWILDSEIWSSAVLRWAEFAERNNVEMFCPGVEMNLILGDEAGTYIKDILPKIRKIYSGKIITAEQFDTENWKRIDNAEAFAGYDCIGLTLFPRKEYDRISDMRSIEDYTEYVENEAEVIDMLSKKYNIQCKLAVPMGLDYWKGSYDYSPVPSAEDVAMTLNIGLDILKQHNFTGVFISHWASEHDHFQENTAVEQMLRNRWIE